jgi:hypothetical protein
MMKEQLHGLWLLPIWLDWPFAWLERLLTLVVPFSDGKKSSTHFIFEQFLSCSWHVVEVLAEASLTPFCRSWVKPSQLAGSARRCSARTGRSFHTSGYRFCKCLPGYTGNWGYGLEISNFIIPRWTPDRKGLWWRTDELVLPGYVKTEWLVVLTMTQWTKWIARN